MPKSVLPALAVLILGSQIAAADGTSVYTKLDAEKTCMWDSLDHLTEAERDELLGNSAICTGLPGYPVHFSEFDLRQFTAFGAVSDESRTPGGFTQFNRTGETIEWRVENGRPYATILRWFIENANPETGEPDPASTGQVLVISTVAQPDNPASCPAGYVDARANTDANVTARSVADTIARDFVCGSDKPEFHGVRGATAGNPAELAQ